MTSLIDRWFVSIPCLVPDGRRKFTLTLPNVFFFVVHLVKAFVLASRDGMSDDELLWSMKVPRMGAFSTLLLAMREQLCTRSAFMTFFHDDARFVHDAESGKCRSPLECCVTGLTFYCFCRADHVRTRFAG